MRLPPKKVQNSKTIFLFSVLLAIFIIVERAFQLHEYWKLKKSVDVLANYLNCAHSLTSLLYFDGILKG